MTWIRSSIIAFATIVLGASLSLADRPLSHATEGPRRPKSPSMVPQEGKFKQYVTYGFPKMIRAFGECRTFRSVRRGNGTAPPARVTIPYRTREEWDRVSAPETKPYNVEVSRNCYCGRDLWMNEVNDAVYEGLKPDDPTIPRSQVDPIQIATPQFPLPGYDPPYQADPATIARVCEAMGCGLPTMIRTRAFEDPSDDALLTWNGSGWVKVPAEWVNRKLDHRAPTLRCADL